MHVMFQQIKNMKKVLLIIFVLASMCANAQVYQLMPQYGYQAPRMAFDSTLQIPTTCGVPTLKSVQFVTKKSAVAFDSCNNKFYTYNPKTQVWSEVSGGSGIDSLKRSTDSIFARKNGSFVFQYKDSIGGGSGSDTAKVVIAQVRNIEATTLQIGEVVYLKSSTGNVASVKRASNKDDSTSSRTLGVVRASIAPNATGFVTTQGQCEKMNLGSFAEGDILWLDSIAGGFTKIKPIAPFHGVFIGIVERANNGNGIAYIRPQNGFELNEIHDVQITNPATNNILLYNSPSKVWQNKAYGLSTLLDAGNQSYTRTSNQFRNMALFDTIGGVNTYMSLQYGGGNTNLLQYQNGIFQSNLSAGTLSIANLQTYGSYIAGGMGFGIDLTLAGSYGHCMQFFKTSTNNIRKLSSKFTTSTQNFATTSYLPETDGTLANKVLLNGTTYNSDDNGQINLGTIGGGIDSLRRSRDSVFARKNGTFIFQYRDSIGGGGSGSTGVNGLNGTTNIGLGGTLSQNTTINGAGYSLNIGTTGSTLTTLKLNGEQVQFENLNPRNIADQSRIAIAVLDTTNNNTLRTIPIGSVGEGKVLRGKFTCIFDQNINDYVVSWKIDKNNTGYTWSLYRFAGGRFNLQNNVVDPNAENAFINDCDWFGGLMFRPNNISSERYGQIFELDKHTAQIKLFDASGNGVDEVEGASFEIRFYENCEEGNSNSPQ